MRRSSMVGIGAGLAALFFAAALPAAEKTATHEDADIRLLAPELVTGGDGYTVEIKGELGTGPFSVFTYKLVRDGAWRYDEDHQVVWDKEGTALADERFNAGDSVARSFPQDLPAGTYRYTFVFGQRSTAHGWYDVALDVDVQVQAPNALCKVEWLSPKTEQSTEGKPLSLKFTARRCADDTFFADEDVVVTLNDAGGGMIQGWLASSDPSTGVVVDDQTATFHVDWHTSGYGKGTFDVEVQFSTGEVLNRKLTLK